MSNPDDLRQFPVTAGPTTRHAGAPLDSLWQLRVGGADLRVPLLNLSTIRTKMDSVQRFLTDSVNRNTLIGEDQMEMVSAEIAAAIHQVIVNGAAILSCSETLNFSSTQSQQIASNPSETPNSIASTSSGSDLKLNSNSKDANLGIPTTDLKVEAVEEETGDDWDIIELDAVELLAEHIHFCDICGKGFKRDANLRMHMRAHGNQFKTPEALAKPERSAGFDSARRMTRFSCPFAGCNRNKLHKKFRPLKSVICVKNHFKRSHCPKMFSCNRCNKKSFSVVADLKSHLKHCGETKWKCSCGTSFSRKDKLFGHMALFEGHMPAVVVEDDEKGKGATAIVGDEEDEEKALKEMELGGNSTDSGFFEGLLEGFDSIENFCLQDVLGSPKGGLSTGMDWVL